MTLITLCIIASETQKRQINVGRKNLPLLLYHSIEMLLQAQFNVSRRPGRKVKISVCLTSS